MKVFLKLGGFLFLAYAVILIFLAATMREMGILLTFNFGIFGLLGLTLYFLVGYLCVNVPKMRKIMLFILVSAILYGLYFFLINSTNMTGRARWFY